MGDALLYYGAILVNLKPAYRAWELDYVVRQVGMRQLVSALAHRTSDYRAMVAETGYGQAVFIGEPGWGELVAVGRRADPAALPERAAALTFDDPINRGVPLHPPRRRRRPGDRRPRPEMRRRTDGLDRDTPRCRAAHRRAVREFCSGRPAHYKIPRYVHLVDGFPMTVTGELRQGEMRERAVDLLGLHDAAGIRSA